MTQSLYAAIPARSACSAVPALFESRLHSLPLVARGKVRDNYAVGADRLLMVASDRISAFDVVMGEPIPARARC
jgi:phosphoribosylaminoimidazole-succinocarboxamide synthase